MDQRLIGAYIAKKRRMKKLTQDQLAEVLGVSDKSIMKWESGKSMPDYGVMDALCGELEITVPELLDGHDADADNLQEYDAEQVQNLVDRIGELEKQKNIMYGLWLIVMGIALLMLSRVLGGNDGSGFVSGLFLGLSIVVMLAGIAVDASAFIKKA